jgi:hypothetical protein
MSLRRWTLGAILVLLVPAAAAAESTAEPKSPSRAAGLSLAGAGVSLGVTLLGAASGSGEVALIGAGSLVLTPSLGEWYSGRYLTVGMGMRAVSLLLLARGFRNGWNCNPSEGCMESPSDRAFQAAGVLTLLSGTAYDLVTASSAARAYNARIAARALVTPTLLAGPSAPGYGLSLSGRF